MGITIRVTYFNLNIYIPVYNILGSMCVRVSSGPQVGFCPTKKNTTSPALFYHKPLYIFLVCQTANLVAAITYAIYFKRKLLNHVTQNKNIFHFNQILIALTNNNIIENYFNLNIRCSILTNCLNPFFRVGTCRYCDLGYKYI